MSDEQELDQLAAAFYGHFDNRAGRVPDPDALRGLFLPGALIVRVEGEAAERLTLEAFLQPRQQLLTGGALTGFHEWETSARTFVSGQLATRLSTYAKEGRLSGAAYAGQGAKSLQLVRTPAGWRIGAVLWEDGAGGAAGWLGTR